MKVEFTAKSVALAIEKGLKELSKKIEEVDVKIIEEGGFFKKAKVELVFEEEKAAKEVAKKATEKTSKTEKPISKKETIKQQNDQEPVKQKTEEAKSPVKFATSEEVEQIIAFGKTFLSEVCKTLNQENKIEGISQEDGICFSISGERMNELIGYRGEALNALQYLLSIIIKNKFNTPDKIFLDIENYKTRRENALINLATRLSQKALKTGKPVKLEPMNAYERKIIHVTLQDNKEVFTKSEGEEPNRRLIIIPSRKDK